MLSFSSFKILSYLILNFNKPRSITESTIIFRVRTSTFFWWFQIKYFIKLNESDNVASSQLIFLPLFANRSNIFFFIKNQNKLSCYNFGKSYMLNYWYTFYAWLQNSHQLSSKRSANLHLYNCFFRVTFLSTPAYFDFPQLLFVWWAQNLLYSHPIYLTKSNPKARTLINGDPFLIFFFYNTFLFKIQNIFKN